MTEIDSTQETGGPRELSANEIKPGLSVWARIIKKGADIPATIISAEADGHGGIRCKLELEVEDPFSGQVIRQRYKKPVPSYQLTLRKRPEQNQETPLGEQPRTAQAESSPRLAETEGLSATSTEPSQAINERLDPASLTYYSRATLKRQGPHDQGRRDFLRAYSKERNYQAFSYIVHRRTYWGECAYDGHRTPEGEEEWTRFLSQATQYDIYCVFIAAYAPGQLAHYLEDAARRGEIKLEDNLIWRGNHHNIRR